MDLSRDWDYIEQIANQRRRNNQTPRHVNKEYLEVIGAAGELAARRFLGLPEKLHVHFDGGTDLRWASWSIDVKTTKLTPNIGHRYLQWPSGKPIRADVILLMGVCLSDRTATPIGWVFATEMIDADINPLRDKPCHEISVPDLHPTWALYSLQNQSRFEKRISQYAAMY